MAFWSGLMIVVAAAIVTVAVSPASAATNHLVGGSFGWNIPPNATFYSEWAATQTFAAGDTLEFNFTKGEHNSARVLKSGYDACNSSFVIGYTMASSLSITLNPDAIGDYYFLCSFPGHCSKGMKLAIKFASESPTATPGGGGSSAATGVVRSGFIATVGFIVLSLVL